jgi:type I restriction enzyme M protein
VSIDEVRANDWSLTPGRYVGVAMEMDDDFDYQARLLEIQSELEVLNAEANQLSSVIADNLCKLIQ